MKYLTIILSTLFLFSCQKKQEVREPIKIDTTKIMPDSVMHNNGIYCTTETVEKHSQVGSYVGDGTGRNRLIHLGEIGSFYCDEKFNEYGKVYFVNKKDANK